MKNESLLVHTSPKKKRMTKRWELETDRVIYFWSGVFSNWAKTPFEAKPFYKIRWNLNDHRFTSVEQYMMASKAIMFNDATALFNILTTDNPKVQKAIGRSVKGFDDEKWYAIARDVVYPAIESKFSSTKELYHTLLSTGDKLIVEASPFDRRWGIGFNPYDAEDNKDKWGENWLGQCIMKARDAFAGIGNRSWIYYEDMIKRHMND